jgi:hypothetical protein
MKKLTKTEKGVYKMIDTLIKLPGIQTCKDTFYFLAVGYKNIGNFEIGPWYNWITYNTLEGLRTRFDLGTDKIFQ